MLVPCRTSACSSTSIPSPEVAFSSQPLALLDVLRELNEELRAYLLLFLELACVGNCAASCQQLHNCLWSDAHFWRIYAGPKVPTICDGTDAAEMREKFRRWLFHLEGMWTASFRAFVEEQKRSYFKADYRQLLADAGYIVTGLMPGDDPREVEDFSEIICSLFDEYHPAMLDERKEAEVLIRKVEHRTDIFGDEQVRNMSAAFEQSIERHILSRAAPEETDLGRYGSMRLHDLSEDDDNMFGDDHWHAREAYPLTDLPVPGAAEESFWTSPRQTLSPHVMPT